MELDQTITAIVPQQQVRFKTINRQLHLLLPSPQAFTDADGNNNPVLSWEEILQQLEQRLAGTERFWEEQTPVYVQVGDRLLDVPQLQEINTALASYNLKLKQIITCRRQTAINAVTAGFSVEQVTKEALPFGSSEGVPTEDPLYIKMTVRSGTEIRHGGSVIIFGDVNAGAEIIADGDILVWGKLRGLAHAGARGNLQAVVMALHFQPTQLRIAHLIADFPTAPPVNPEIAYVENEEVIVVKRAMEYEAKSASFWLRA
ncbi:MAG: septum site-determining protein MinC [Pseudanabaenaceae cyanobacterium]